jgi:hypothetical protein
MKQPYQKARGGKPSQLTGWEKEVTRMVEEHSRPLAKVF